WSLRRRVVADDREGSGGSERHLYVYHGALSDDADDGRLKTYGDFVREFVQAVQTAKRSGRTIEEFVSSWKLPEGFVMEGYVDIGNLRPLRPDVEVIWNETR